MFHLLHSSLPLACECWALLGFNTRFAPHSSHSLYSVSHKTLSLLFYVFGQLNLILLFRGGETTRNSNLITYTVLHSSSQNRWKMGLLLCIKSYMKSRGPFKVQTSPLESILGFADWSTIGQVLVISPHTTTLQMALVSTRSVVNKTFVFNDSLTSSELDFIFLIETCLWPGKSLVFSELLSPPGCSFLNSPQSAGKREGLVSISAVGIRITT